MPRGDDNCTTPLPPPPTAAGALLDDEDVELAVSPVAASPLHAMLDDEDHESDGAPDAPGAASMLLDESAALDLRSFAHQHSYACDYTDQLLAWSGLRGAKPAIDGLPCPPVCPECQRVPEAAFYAVYESATDVVSYLCERCAPALLGLGASPRWGSRRASKDAERVARGRSKYEAQVAAGRAQPRPFDPDADPAATDQQPIIDLLEQRLAAGADDRRDRLDARRSLDAYARALEQNPLMVWPARQLEQIVNAAQTVAEAENDQSVVRHDPGEVLEDLLVEIKRYKAQRNDWGTRYSFTGVATTGHRYWLAVNAGSPEAKLLASLPHQNDYRDQYDSGTHHCLLTEPQTLRISRAEVKSQGDDRQITFLKRPKGKGSRNIVSLGVDAT